MNDDGPLHHDRTVRKGASELEDYKVRGRRPPTGSTADVRRDLLCEWLDGLQIHLIRSVQVPLHGVPWRMKVFWQHAAFLIDSQRKHGAISTGFLNARHMMIGSAQPFLGRADDVATLL